MRSIYAIDSPIGIITAEEDNGLVTALYLQGLPHPAWEGVPQTNLAQELQEYFAGKRKVFSVPFQIEGPAFAVKARNAALAIPYGGTVSYAALAAAAGNSKAARAAGQAMAFNPLPILIPCHRVLYSSGKKQQYAGGPQMKEFLLDLERSHP